jgi:heat shock protein HslJ
MAAAPTTDPLIGSAWSLAGVGERLRPPAPDTQPTLQFLDGGGFSAHTGCNVLLGRYEVDGEHLRLTSGPMTRRACLDEAAAEQESAICRAFDAVRSMTLGSDRLALLDDVGAVLLVFGSLPTGLAGTSWRVTGVNTGSAVETSELTEELTLELGDGGRASGHAGCNRFHGTYALDDDGLSFGPLATTKLGCDPERMALEAAYLAALGRVTGVRRVGTSLDLLASTGTTQVTLAPVS